MPDHSPPSGDTYPLPEYQAAEALRVAFGPHIYRQCRNIRAIWELETPEIAANWITLKVIERAKKGYYRAAAYTDEDRANADRATETDIRFETLWRLALYGARTEELERQSFIYSYSKTACQNYAHSLGRDQRTADAIADEEKSQHTALFGENTHPSGGQDPEQILVWRDLFEKLVEHCPERLHDMQLVWDKFVEQHSIDAVCAKYNCKSTEPYNARDRVQRALLQIDPGLAGQIRKPKTKASKTAA